MIADSLNLQAIADTLAAISGHEHVRSDGGSLRIAPATTEEIAAVLRYAHENGITVNPYGGGTKQDWGNPCSPMLELRTSRRNAVLEHPWQDMTCTVEAGCTWASMQAALANHGQFVALDPLYPEQATIGGIIATNDSGSLRLKYGSLRDLVIGMTIVLPDGTIARTGGKVVKNVAGYDLHKLMTGAFGTLGVISEVTFRLHSIPRHTQSFTIPSGDAEPLGKLLLKILDSHLSAQCVQLRSNEAGFHLDVQLAALPEVMQDQAASLAVLAQGYGLASGDAKMDVWTTRQKHFEQTESFVAKVTMLPSEIAELASAVRSLGGTSVTQAVGVMIATLPVTNSAGLLQLRQRVEGRHGSLTILHQGGVAALDTWGTPPDTLPVMREIKLRFDPHRILNPGRFLGGI